MNRYYSTDILYMYIYIEMNVEDRFCFAVIIRKVNNQ